MPHVQSVQQPALTDFSTVTVLLRQKNQEGFGRMLQSRCTNYKFFAVIPRSRSSIPHLQLIWSKLILQPDEKKAPGLATQRNDIAKHECYWDAFGLSASAI